MNNEQDWASVATKLKPDERLAVLMMGQNMDTCIGFDVQYTVMQNLLKRGLVNIDDQDEHSRNPIYWLNRNGLQVHHAIAQQNISARRNK